MLLPLQSRVALIHIEPVSDQVRQETQGTIVGYGFHTHEDGSVHLMYLVKFDGGGFYNPSNTVWVNILPVHHSNVEPIA